MNNFDFYKLMQLSKNPDLFEQERQKILQDFFDQYQNDKEYQAFLRQIQDRIESKHELLKQYIQTKDQA
ncbi:hypothetical protein [methane-oxidizing endosymbiont of Gigantopelta aegis]|uniref:hypothetical protein n=1 Tax=methane-oxidizing endosymbiont of Gigantopelta aegis TaxID=2794938 RepID=UPI0018DB0580|nr:hypothetical protein [methane-oxidizing endosymbiont of Gigantopelta aegis]